MTEIFSPEMDSVIQSIAEIIAKDVDSLYELDFESGLYREIKCSPFLLRTFGSDGDLSRFLTRILMGEPAPDGADLFKDFYKKPELTGKVFGKQVALEAEGESQSMYFMYFKADIRTAYAFFYPADDRILLDEEESYRTDALKKYLFSMIVDLDKDECTDFYISEFTQPSPSQRALKTSYSGWRKSLSSGIEEEHLGSFMDNTDPLLVRQKLMMFSRHSFAVRMHNLRGQVLWTLHTMLRIQDAAESHLSFVYTVQDIDADMISFLPQYNSHPASGGSNKAAASSAEINAAVSKTIQSLAPFSEIILEHVESEIRNNYKDKLSLKQLAGKYYINTAYLGQLFIQKHGVTFHDFLARIRMENAAVLLTGTSYSIARIAELCGIPNTNYFHRQFKQHFGCTPLEYKNQRRACYKKKPLFQLAQHL